jgi:PBSX family phage terminase large subunit
MISSEKQRLSILEATHAYNIWVGSVRAGKTFASVRKLMELMQFGVPGDVMIIGVNRESIHRNVIVPLFSMFGFPTPGPKIGHMKLFGRIVYFVGAPDEGAVRTIKGSTLSLAYVDEITELPENFWLMLIGRLSIKGAQLLGTTNPDGPCHWLKKDFIDRAAELDLISWNFTLDDNPILDEAYKSRIKASYSGLWYKRYILGEWALAHGAIYDGYDHENEFNKDYPQPNYYIVGIDYGTTNATAAVLCAVSPRSWPQIRVEEEYYWDSAKKGRSKTDEELVQDIMEFIQHKHVSAIYVDPAAASLKIALRRQDLPVLDANNDVLLGIKICSKFISGKNLLVHKRCEILREQLQSYAWDHKAAEKGEDKPVKKNDHSVDALRYALVSAFPKGEFSHPDENISYDQLRRKIFGGNDMYDNFNNDVYQGGF